MESLGFESFLQLERVLYNRLPNELVIGVLFTASIIWFFLQHQFATRSGLLLNVPRPVIDEHHDRHSTKYYIKNISNTMFQSSTVHISLF